MSCVLLVPRKEILNSSLSKGVACDKGISNQSSAPTIYVGRTALIMIRLPADKMLVRSKWLIVYP